ncbi:beta strand repeat-containing protein, partial [Nocardia vaccinii]|uniref:beta strand repeat-containing protein n=1 Tax=Nocardia vaccinii TaxID=1822 RepID=UPI000ABAC6D6
VVLTGTNLTGATAVSFGGTPATSFTVDSATQITAVAPAHAAGTVQVTVTTAGGTSNGVAFTYVAVPTLTAVVPNVGSVIGGTTVVLTGTNLTGATAVSFGGTPATSFTVDSATQITAVAPAGTVGTVLVTVTTAGGTSNGVAFTYVAVPTLSTVVPNAGSVAGGTTVVLTGTNLTGATAVSFGATPATSFTVDSATQITAVAPAGTAGTVQVTVTTAGGTSNGVAYTYIAVPTLIAAVPNVGSVTGGTTVVLTGTALTGATAVSFGGTPATSFTVDSATKITAVAPAGTAGTVLITVTTAGGTSNGVAYTYVAVPTLITVVPNVGPVTGGTTVVLTGTNLTGATAVSFGGTPATSFTVDSATQITAVAPAGIAGTVQVTVTTAGGTSNGVAFTYVAVPTLTAIVPNVGSVTGGTTVVLTGTDLTGATAVNFGGTPATSFTVDSPTQITAVAPAGTAGTVLVTVTTAGGTSNGGAYTYVAVPTLTSLTPTSGSVAGGITVVLTGTNLTGATAVSFDGTPATSFTVDSATRITAVAPAHAAGIAQVTVTTVGGTSNGVAYTYVPVPALTSVVPNSGPVTGDTVVVLTGTGLTGATAVDFGANPSILFVVDSDSRITALVPPGTAGTVQVTVTTPGGTSNGVTFVYTAAPTLTTVVPNAGPVTGANTVVLTGTGLTGATALNFDGAPATSFTVDSDTRITAVAPTGTGTVLVTVTTAGGTSNGVAYTYIAVPALTTISPNAGPAGGGTVVVLTGTGLTGATAVHFGATPATLFTADSDTRITALTPAGTAGTVQVTVTTAGGTSNGVAYTYIAVPVLTTISPNAGPVTGGTTVVLTGTALTGATGVNFGGTSAISFTVDSATRITAVAPAGVAGTVQVTVTTGGGTSNGLGYTYVNVPTLLTGAPDLGPEAGGTTVVLTGTDLTGATAVDFGATPAASFTVDSDTQITAMSPAGTGLAEVTVTTPGGTSNNVFFTYLPVPTLTSVVPNSGPETGGDSVTLTGTNFAFTTEVSFGTAPAAFVGISDTQTVATSPAGTGTVQVTVTTPGGTSNGISYTYVPAPGV